MQAIKLSAKKNDNSEQVAKLLNEIEKLKARLAAQEESAQAGLGEAERKEMEASAQGRERAGTGPGRTGTEGVAVVHSGFGVVTQSEWCRSADAAGLPLCHCRPATRARWRRCRRA